MEKRRQPEVVAGRVNADGSTGAGSGFVSSRLAAGSYLIAFSPRMTPVGATANTQGGGGYVAQIVFDQGDSAMRVITSSAGTATDLAFTFVAVGVQV